MWLNFIVDWTKMRIILKRSQISTKNLKKDEGTVEHKHVEGGGVLDGGKRGVWNVTIDAVSVVGKEKENEKNKGNRWKIVGIDWKKVMIINSIFVFCLIFCSLTKIL